ncbi:MAG: hypothetical protein QGG64_12410 [Candidatus Latescibacteria bacterium]|jgi:hypothetical protein|nr:hypothetical protein [Candidatus Latescibacterota bacterium]
MADDITLDGDPRKLAMAVFRAALGSYKQKHGDLSNFEHVKKEVEQEIPKLAQQMAEALEGEVRDVYLMNALELMALDYMRDELK